MKFFSVTTSVILLASSVAVSAWLNPWRSFAVSAWPNPWRLDLYLRDGGHVSAHGRGDSGCVNWDLDVGRSPATRVVFKEGTFDGTFELFTARDCRPPVSFRENDGSYQLRPPRIIRSYKVY